jgi:hypothetical protein
MELPLLLLAIWFSNFCDSFPIWSDDSSIVFIKCNTLNRKWIYFPHFYNLDQTDLYLKFVNSFQKKEMKQFSSLLIIQKKSFFTDKNCLPCNHIPNLKRCPISEPPAQSACYKHGWWFYLQPGDFSLKSSLCRKCSLVVISCGATEHVSRWS